MNVLSKWRVSGAQMRLRVYLVGIRSVPLGHSKRAMKLAPDEHVDPGVLAGYILRTRFMSVLRPTS